MKGASRLAGIITLAAVVLLLGSCTNQGDAPEPADKVTHANAALAEMLPDKEGFTWVYNGFAEYGHRMVLERIESQDGQIVYFVTGDVEDVSGGESKKDFSIELEYVIKDGVLVQKKKEQVMLDSVSDNIQLLRAPLDPGNRWDQKVITKEGNEIDLSCQITEIKEESGKRLVTVLYEDKNGDYFERRTFREGAGVISLEKLFQSQGELFTVGYTLFEDASGYPNS